MRNRLEDYLGFNISTLHAEIPASYRDYEASLRHLRSSSIFVPKPYRSRPAGEAFRLIAMVEHEFFHSRHTFGTTFGWLLHYIMSYQTDCRSFLVDNFDFEGLIKARGSFLHSFREYRKNPDATQMLSVFLYFETLLDLLNDPSEESREHFDLTSRALAPWFSRTPEVPYAGAGLNTRPSYLSNVFPFKPIPSVTVFDQHTRSFSNLSLWHLLEGVATWKEYAEISRLAWTGKRDQFQEITREWLGRSDGKPLYRSASDLILQACGCNMSAALPGVIFDLALNPDLLSQTSWKDFHPIARFNQLLRHANDLPSRYKNVDNCDSPGEDYYLDVERFFQSRLGWARTAEASSGLITSLKVDASKILRTRNYPAGNALAFDKFIRAHAARAQISSTFIFPWNSPEAEALGYEIRPLLVEWSDAIHLSAMNDLEQCVLSEQTYDTLRRLVLELMIQVKPKHGRDLGHIERLYQKACDAIPNPYAPTDIYEFVAQVMKITVPTLKTVVIRRFI